MNAQLTSLPEPLEALLDSELYPGQPDSVELRETHISWVFLAGDVALKVKKPLVLPFLDYGTLERRREMCREEVRLNRRLAPSIYLDVVALARRDGGYELAPEDDPQAVEYAVRMRRVDESRSLETLASRGTLSDDQITAVASVLASFHADAPRAGEGAGTVDALTATLEENLETLRREGAEDLGEPGLAAAEAFTRAFVAARSRTIDDRAGRGLVRDCHGDLRAEHVILPRDEPVYVYDCVEFNPSLREIDVSADLAFLVMDLHRLGEADRAEALVAAYRAEGGDPGDDGLLHFFAAYRAWVRAKVACIRAHEQDGPSRARSLDDARALLELGRRLAWRARGPLVLAIAGLSGTGKTTLARELARISGWIHVSSDETRKRLAGLSPTQRAGERQYSQDATARTYTELGRLAGEDLEHGAGAIVDATFHTHAKREAFLSGLGQDAAGSVLFIELTGPQDVLADRVRERLRDPERVSDAQPELIQRQLAERDAIDELPAEQAATMDCRTPVAELASRAEALVDERLIPGS